MPPIIASRASLPTLLLLAAASLHAQTLPPAPPTSAPPAASALPSAVQSIANSAPAASGRAKVQFANGLLTVNATDSSLNQILREISRITGMTITGGVKDERVFGTYGPADTGAVLTSLLNGTGSNMLLLESHNNSPRELVLTPRQGGPTPPSPNTYREPEAQSNEPRNITPREDIIYQPPAGQPPPPQPGVTTPDATQQPQQQPTPDSGTTTQQSPNGVKTPQQIYEELMKMQQQQSTPSTPH